MVSSDASDVAHGPQSFVVRALNTPDACSRRAAWLVIGREDEDGDGCSPDDDELDCMSGRDYLVLHPVNLCAWCKPRCGRPLNDSEVSRALAPVRTCSVSWRWRWRAE